MEIQDIWNEIGDLHQHDMFNLLCAYDTYILEVCDREDGSQPVGLVEFFTNDYEVIKEGSICP